MKVGILTHIKHPIVQPFAGGLESFTYDITTRLQARGHDVTLFATAGAAAELPVETMAVSAMHCDDGDRHPYDISSTNYIAEHHAYMDCMQRIDGFGFDVILNNALHYAPITMAGTLATPMLTVLHTPPFFELINAVVARGARERGRYCTVSHSNAAQWAPFLPACDVIANGIDLSLWHPPPAYLPQRHWRTAADESAREAGFTDGSHVMWFGRLVADKGAHLAMDAARLAGLDIRIAGKITDQAYFDAEIAPRLSGTAVFLGHLDRSALVRELGRAAVCAVTPLWEEPFGLVVAEAMACGTPVAAFSRGALPELISASTGVVVTDGDVAALAAALIAASALSGVACRARAERLWDIDTMVDHYEMALLDLIHPAHSHV